MNKSQTKLPTDTWITATWEEYIQTIEDPSYEKAKSYYNKGKFRQDFRSTAIYGIFLVIF